MLSSTVITDFKRDNTFSYSILIFGIVSILIIDIVSISIFGIVSILIIDIVSISIFSIVSILIIDIVSISIFSIVSILIFGIVSILIIDIVSISIFSTVSLLIFGIASSTNRTIESFSYILVDSNGNIVEVFIINCLFMQIQIIRSKKKHCSSIYHVCLVT